MSKQTVARGRVDVSIVCIGVLLSASVWSAPQASVACHDQDVVLTDAASHDAGRLEPLATRLDQYLRRMYCTTQRILVEPTLERRRPYEEARQGAALAIEDLLSHLQLTATAANETALTAFARAFYTFGQINSTIASDALLAETPAETVGVKALSDGKGQAAFGQVYAALQPLVALLGDSVVDAKVSKTLEDTIKRGDLSKLKALIEQTPSLVNAKVRGGKSLIERVANYAVWHRPRHTQMAQYLLEQGARCDIFTAARAGLLGHVKTLLTAQPDLLNAQDAKGRTPLYRAACVYGAFKEGEAVADFLMAQGAEVDIYTASTLGMINRIWALLQRDSGLAVAQDPDGMTALHWAARCRRHCDHAVAMTRLLLHHGADVHARQPDGMQPIHHLGEWAGQPKQVDLLLEHGADINALSTQGWTPLDYAIDRGRQAMARYLRQRGGEAVATKIDPTLAPRVIGEYVLPDATRRDLHARGMSTPMLDALESVHILSGSHGLHAATRHHHQVRLIPRGRTNTFGIRRWRGDQVVFVFGEDGRAARATGLRATVREASDTFTAVLVRPGPTADPSRDDREPWSRAPLPDGTIDIARLKAIVETIRAEHHGDIHSLMIVQDGHVVLEEYFRGSSRSHAHQMRSASKSVGSVLLGIAMDRGLVSETHKIVDIFKTYTIKAMSPDKASMTVQDVLTMRSGLSWKQWGYRGPETDGYRMWQSPDHIQYILDRPMAHPPGEVFNYSDGVSNLIGGVLDATTGMSARAFADAFLFEPLGITSAAWWGSDKQGHLGMGYGLKLTTPDMARFGLLVLNEGTWGDQQVVSGAYLRRALTLYSPEVGGTMSYGYQWWGLPVMLRNQFEYIYGALGLGGQQIWIVPPLRAVIVVTAWERDRPGREFRELLITELLPALEGK
ncbi:MAG: serine hydrolase [Candidatus Tectomicrobia bacterium]